MRKVIFSIIVISAILMALFTYTAIKSGNTTGNVIGNLTRFNVSDDYSDTNKDYTSKEKISNIKIVNFVFSPIKIEINTGEAISWKNSDSARHTITSKDGIFDSGLIEKDKTFYYKFEEPGTYSYYCSTHPYITGKIIVKP